MKKQSLKHSKQLLIEFAMFCLLVASIVLLWKDNLMLSIVVVGECFLALGFWHDKYDLGFFLVVAMLGSVAEIVFVYFGVWCYANPSFFGVPFWFPLAFGLSGLICERFVRTVLNMWEKRGNLEGQGIR